MSDMRDNLPRRGKVPTGKYHKMRPSALGKDVFAGGILQLSVGEEEVPFDAHILLLCSKSPFFEKALDGPFLEAKTNQMDLPEDDPDTFADFLSWMYRMQVSVEDKSCWIDLCKLWVMADKYQVPELQQMVLRIMSTKWEQKPDPKGNLHPDLLNYVYENTLETSALRKAICNICVYGMEASKLAEHISDYPPEFVAEYAIMQAKRASNQMPPKPNIAFPIDEFKDLKVREPHPDKPKSESEVSGLD